MNKEHNKKPRLFIWYANVNNAENWISYLSNYLTIIWYEKQCIINTWDQGLCDYLW